MARSRESTRARLARLRREAPSAGSPDGSSASLESPAAAAADSVESNGEAAEAVPQRPGSQPSQPLGGAVPEAAGAEPGLASARSDPGRVARLERLRTRLAGRGAVRRELDRDRRGTRDRRATEEASASGPEPTCPRTAGPPERLERVETAVGPAWARVERFGPGATHGAWALQEAFEPSAR